jgi:DNA-binding CsgD family transcriptional regulator
MALAFTRPPRKSFGAAAASLDGRLVRPGDMRRPASPIPWIVDLDHVPKIQQNRWMEPIRAGVHGKDYFLKANPLPMHVMNTCEPPDYGRIMLCYDGRMLAWLGLYVEGRRGFRDDERATLERVAAQLAAPLRLAALLQSPGEPIRLSRRQTEVIERVARGWTNKQIAKDLEISPATVKTLLERLFRLSGALNRAALVLWWRSADPRWPNG